jgi:hypothetical protein
VTFDVWRRLEPVAPPAPTAAGPLAATKSESERAAATRRRRKIFAALDAIGTLAWAYAITKLFIIDVDRLLLEAISPNLVGILNYRIFFYLGLAVAAGFFLRHRKVWWLAILYVLLFPVVVIAYKIPAYFVRRRSWPLVFAAVQATAGFFADFRYNLTTKSFALLACVLILTTDAAPLLVVSASYLAVLMIWSFWRLARRALSASSFIAVQRSIILRFLFSPFIQKATDLGDEYRRPEIEKYAEAEAQQVMLKISLGIAVNKALYFWAYQLDNYRRRFLPSVLFSGLSFAWLFLGVVLGLALVNFALLKVSPSEYEFTSPPSFIAVLVYSLATLSLGTGGGIEPIGDIAYAIQFLSGITGILVLAALVLNVIATVRRERDEAATSELVADLKNRAREHERRFVDDYAVSIDEAIRRLESIGTGFAYLLRFVAVSIPDDFLTDRDRA